VISALCIPGQWNQVPVQASSHYGHRYIENKVNTINSLIEYKKYKVFLNNMKYEILSWFLNRKILIGSGYTFLLLALLSVDPASFSFLALVVYRHHSRKDWEWSSSWRIAAVDQRSQGGVERNIHGSTVIHCIPW
jgi:hypothetical protein